MSIDPLWEEFRSLSPYNYAENNPLVLKDPSGENPLLGFAIGAGLDYALQVVGNFADGKKGLDAFTDVNVGSILVSGASGALGVGLASSLSKMGTVARIGTELTIDGATSAVSQYVNNGEVSVTNTLVDVTAGQIAGATVGKLVESSSLKTAEGKVLSNNADRTQRVADKALSRQEAKTAKAIAAKENLNSYVAQRVASASIATTSVVSNVITIGVNHLQESQTATATVRVAN